MLLTYHFVCNYITYILVDNFVYRTPSDLQKCHGSVCLRGKKKRKHLLLKMYIVYHSERQVIDIKMVY